jgi:HlyD family secretion protein
MTRPGKLHPLVLASVVANVALAAGVGYLVFAAKKPGPSTLALGGAGQPSSQAAAGAVESLGRIQPAGGVIAVYGPPGDRLKSVVPVGKTVAAGDTLATLSGDDERQLNLKTLAAQIAEAEALKAAIEAAAQAKLDDLQAEANQATAGLAQDTKVLDAKEKAAAAQAERGRADLKRMTEVKADGVPVSKQEFETVNALLATAEAEVAVALAQKEKLRVQKEQSAASIEAKKKAVKAEASRAVAQVPLASLEAARKVADQKVKDAVVTAPTPGRVVKVAAKVGETLASQPILYLADPAKLVVQAEVYETDVGRLREWAAQHGSVAVEIDARVVAGGSGEKKLTGRVTGVDRVATLISKNVLTPLGPREDADRRVVDVEVDLDPDAVAVAQNFIGLQVRTRFLPPK